MADHNKPTITSTYANYTSELDARMDDLAMLNDPSVTTVTNPSNGYKRWNSISYKFEKYNSGSWVDLSTQYILGAMNTIKDAGTTFTSASNASPTLDVINTNPTGSSRLRVISTQGSDTSKGLDVFYAPSTFTSVPSQASFGVVESYANKGLILSALNGTDGIKLQVGNRVDALKIKNDSVMETVSDIGVGTSVSKPSGFNRFVAIGDSDSGIGQLSDGYISVATNGIERARFNPVNWNLELGTGTQGNTSAEVDIYIGNQTNQGYVFGNNDQFGLRSTDASLVIDKRSGSNSNAWLTVGNTISIIGDSLHLYTGGSVKRALNSLGTISGSCTDSIYEYMTLTPSGSSVSKGVKLANAGTSVQKTVSDDVYNENAIPLGGSSCSVNTDGSLSQVFTVTPSGARTSDRRISALGIHGDASIHAYNGAVYAKSGNGSVNNTNNCGYVFVGDSDTGMFNPVEGLLQLLVNGAAVFGAAGNDRQFLYGPSNAYSLSMQSDGNLVVYDGSSNVKFSAFDFANFYAGVKSPIGWRKLPDGTIEQWGYVDNPGAGSGTVTLPTSFPSAIWNIQITRKTPSSDYWPVQVNGTPSLGSFPWSQTGNNVNTSFYWRALGK